MIARPPNAQAALAHRFGGPVSAGAPMTVGEGEQVVLAHLGTITRIVGPGSYQVPAEFAGDGVEAWFVTTRPLRGVKFGGPVRIPGVRAVFGTCSVKVVTPDRLVAQLVGMGDGAAEGVLRHVQAQLLAGAKTALAMGKTAMPDLERAMLDHVATLRDAMGVAVLEIGMLNVTA